MSPRVSVVGCAVDPSLTSLKGSAFEIRVGANEKKIKNTCWHARFGGGALGRIGEKLELWMSKTVYCKQAENRTVRERG